MSTTKKAVAKPAAKKAASKPAKKTAAKKAAPAKKAAAKDEPDQGVQVDETAAVAEATPMGEGHILHSVSSSALNPAFYPKPE